VKKETYFVFMQIHCEYLGEICVKPNTNNSNICMSMHMDTITIVFKRQHKKTKHCLPNTLLPNHLY